MELELGRPEGKGLTTVALPLALVHPSAQKMNSANFALARFSEVGYLRRAIEYASTYSPLRKA
jgi:hypothetical protein